MELSTKARPKSAFVTPTDKYEFTRCPFGLTQAPAYFQRLINKVLAGLDFAFGYLDDILIHSSDVPTHLVHMRQLFQRLREADLKLNREKCNFFKSHIQYFGTFNFWRRNQTFAREVGEHQRNASPNYSIGSKTILRSNRLL